MTEPATPYTPDPTAVRAIAERILRSEIEQIRDLGAMDVGEMREDEITAIHESLGGWDAPGASDAADALINAVREDIKAAVISHAWPGAVPAEDESAHVWTGYDDDEAWFPLFATKETAQAYAEQRFRDEMTGLGHDMGDIEIAWSEREAYTKKHGHAGLFDLIEETGGSGYAVCTLPVHKTAAEAQKYEAREMVR